jgi:hypothetical protein
VLRPAPSDEPPTPINLLPKGCILIIVCKRIYLDTDLWNALFYQKIDPGNLMQRLLERNAYLTFSSHNLYEIAKSFLGTKTRTKAKGQDLVAFLMNFFDGSIQHPIDNPCGFVFCKGGLFLFSLF